MKLEKETTVSKPGGLSGKIRDASKVADSYISEITNGIKVHPKDDDNTGWIITDVLEYIKSGVTQIKLWMENNMPKLRLGEEGKAHLELDYRSIRVIDKDNITFFHISDLREKDGAIAIETSEIFKGSRVSTADLPVIDLSVFNLYNIENWKVMIEEEGQDPVDDTENWELHTISEEIEGENYELAYEVERINSRLGLRTKATFTGTGQSFKAQRGYTLGTRNNRSFVGFHSVVTGKDCKSSGFSSYAEGIETESSNEGSHAEGCQTKAISKYCHAEGMQTEASGFCSHSQGSVTEARGSCSHSEGSGTHADGNYSHAEGFYTYADKNASHVEGTNSFATGTASHAEGNKCNAYGNYSHSEGSECTASGEASHAEGLHALAFYKASHASGCHTHTASDYQTTIGRYNTGDSQASFIIGGGTENESKNIFYVTWGGTTWATSFQSLSDLKDKDLIPNFNWNVDDFILGLKPIAYRWNNSEDDNKIHMGFGAQDVYKLTQDLGLKDIGICSAQYKVNAEKYNGEEVDDSELNWHLSYADFIAPMVLEIQKLMTKVSNLEDKVEELTNKLETQSKG